MEGEMKAGRETSGHRDREVDRDRVRQTGKEEPR